jgi:DNA-binding NarL/FixJ family response regulator
VGGGKRGWPHTGLRAATRLCGRSIGAGHNAGAERECQHVEMRPRVLIVDDHAAFRESASALLEAEGFDVVGEAADGESAIAEVRRLRPEIVLIDVQLPGLDGFGVAERLAEGTDAPVVILISSREAGAYGSRVDDAPVRGFLAKRSLSGAALAGLVR